MSVKITPIIPRISLAFQKAKTTKLALGLALGIIAGGAAFEGVSVAQINNRTDEIKKMLVQTGIDEFQMEKIQKAVETNSKKFIHWYDLPSARAAKVNQEWQGNLIYRISMLKYLFSDQSTEEPKSTTTNI